MTALRFLVPTLAPQLQDSGRTLETVADSAVVVSSLLEGFEGMPLGPSAPLDANQLRDAARQVKRLGATADKLLALVGDATRNHADEADAQTAAMEKGIARALPTIRDMEQQVQSVRDRVVEVRTHFVGWLTTAAVVATVLLTWAGIGQLSLVFHGLELSRFKT